MRFSPFEAGFLYSFRMCYLHGSYPNYTLLSTHLFMDLLIWNCNGMTSREFLHTIKSLSTPTNLGLSVSLKHELAGHMPMQYVANWVMITRLWWKILVLVVAIELFVRKFIMLMSFALILNLFT